MACFAEETGRSDEGRGECHAQHSPHHHAAGAQRGANTSTSWAIQCEGGMPRLTTRPPTPHSALSPPDRNRMVEPKTGVSGG